MARRRPSNIIIESAKIWYSKAMKATLLYKPNSEHERVVIDYVRDFGIQTGKTLPVLDAESRDAIDLCQTYDIMRFPAIIVTGDDGAVQQLWQGEPLPRIGELSYFVPDGRG